MTHSIGVMGQTPQPHLAAKGALSSVTTRAFPLPKVEGGGAMEIAARLAVEKSPRYLPESGKTFCNIYAHDFTHQAGVFIPRVWWATSALNQIKAGGGTTPPIVYGETVFEMNANALHDWLAQHGDDFGWVRTGSPGAVQAAATAGRICCITAKQKDPKRSGHITIVMPEGEGRAAIRTQDLVRIPVQSQAGRKNCQCGVEPGEWWTSSNYADFGFWVNNKSYDGVQST